MIWHNMTWNDATADFKRDNQSINLEEEQKVNLSTKWPRKTGLDAIDNNETPGFFSA
jgi:hypothetical protein